MAVSLVRDSRHCRQLCISYAVTNASVCYLQLDCKLLVKQSCILKELAKGNLDLQHAVSTMWMRPAMPGVQRGCCYVDRPSVEVLCPSHQLQMQLLSYV